MRRPRPLLAVVAIALLAWAGSAAGQALEQGVKANYLYKFAPFVEWPADAFASPASPLNVCVVGADGFMPVVERAAAGQRFGDHPIVVRRLERAERGSPCHIAYLRGPAVADGLAALRGSRVLTVTDDADGGAAQGVVHFVVAQNRVRFQIDDRAAAQNGLAISSKLLDLAISVRPRR